MDVDLSSRTSAVRIHQDNVRRIKCGDKGPAVPLHLDAGPSEQVPVLVLGTHPDPRFRNMLS